MSKTGNPVPDQPTKHERSTTRLAAISLATSIMLGAGGLVYSQIDATLAADARAEDAANRAEDLANQDLLLQTGVIVTSSTPTVLPLKTSFAAETTESRRKNSAKYKGLSQKDASWLTGKEFELAPNVSRRVTAVCDELITTPTQIALRTVTVNNTSDAAVRGLAVYVDGAVLSVRGTALEPLGDSDQSGLFQDPREPNEKGQRQFHIGSLAPGEKKTVRVLYTPLTLGAPSPAPSDWDESDPSCSGAHADGFASDREGVEVGFNQGGKYVWIDNQGNISLGESAPHYVSVRTAIRWN